MSRIFLSHSSKNNAEALALRDWLATQGWHDVFLDIDPERGLVASDRWQRALNAAIGRCRAVIFLLSPEWRASEHCISELDLAMHAGAERIGVIIKPLQYDKIPTGLGGESQLINLTRGGTPLTFTVNPPPERKAVQITFPAEDLRALRNGLARLGLVGFDTDSFPWPPTDDPHRAPFRGLEALDVKDAGVFFGRDTDLVCAREELIDLRAKGGRKLFVIVGASGSGKSSFLRAGLWPRLEREDRDFVTLPLIRPGNAGLSGTMGLAASLERAFEALRQPRAFGDIVAALQQDADALPSLLNQLQVLAMQRLVGDAKPQVDRPPTLVLPVDQAEELFAVGGSEESVLLRRHLAAALTRGPDTIGLLTIRSDRFSLLQNDELLRHLLEPFNLPPITSSVYRDAILKPAARANPPIEIDTKLADALITDMATEGGDPLPLLAFTMERLYRRYGRVERERQGRKSRFLTSDDYTAIGGLAGSIDAAISEAFADPRRDPEVPANRKEQERLLEAAFIPALVDINPANGQPLSRAATERQLPDDSLNIVRRLVDARLLISDRGQAGADGARQTTYRVAHEAVLRRWSWLSTLLEQQVSHLNMAHLIERQAEGWNRSGKLAGWLDLRGDRLREALQVAGRTDFRRRLDGLPAQYLAACRRLESKAAWRRRTGYAAVLALLVIVGGLTATLARWEPIATSAAFRVMNLTKDLTKPGTVFQDCLSCPELAVVPAGSFMMGLFDIGPLRDRDDYPYRKVTIDRQFAVGKFEVTFAQWNTCVDAGGCEHRPNDREMGQGVRPVIVVSWDHITTQYLPWLNKLTGQTYRLLSEAEWEYAARAGTTTLYSWGDEVGSGNANCNACGSQWDGQGTAPVGSFKPNAFGLYDMHGNVREWVQDCHDRKAPNAGSAAPDTRNCGRVLRGGSWQDHPLAIGAAERDWGRPEEQTANIGFRVARVLSVARTN